MFPLNLIKSITYSGNHYLIVWNDDTESVGVDNDYYNSVNYLNSSTALSKKEIYTNGLTKTIYTINS